MEEQSAVTEPLHTQKVTSYDVARQAGVSQSTVAAVFSGTRGIRVSEGTRQRVLAVAAELQYTPNLVARSLRRQRSHIIGFISFTPPEPVSPQPITQNLVGSYLAGIAMRHTYHILEATLETEAPQAGAELVNFLLSKRVDGIIFDRPHSITEIQQFQKRNIPVVQLLRPQIEAGTDMIMVDATLGIAAAVHHLHELGHHRIAFIGSRDPHIANRSRFDHFAEELAHHHIPLPDTYIRLGETYGTEDGYVAAQALLALPEPPTAIFAANDGAALGALRALYHAHIRVPDQMSVISYDNIIAPYTCPALTSVVQPFQAIAEQAIKLILRRLDTDQKQDPPTRLLLPTHLVIRESTRAL